MKNITPDIPTLVVYDHKWRGVMEFFIPQSRFFPLFSSGMVEKNEVPRDNHLCSASELTNFFFAQGSTMIGILI